jgi:predicted O-methyltransferase YrrM
VVAQASIAEVSDAAEVIAGLFDDGLTEALAKLDTAGERLDLVFVDGHHDEDATIHYAQRLLPRLQPGALMIFDDIYLSQEMSRAWARLRTMPGASAAVNVGRFGILVWTGGEAAPAQFDLSRYTGGWRVGGPRAYL